MKFRKQEFLGIITARKGSKRIPKKNIKKLAGKPLIEYTFNAVKNSKLLNRCIVSSDDDEIIEFSKNNNMEAPFKRPSELSTDETLTIDVLIHAINYLIENEDYKPNYIVGLQPTSPLRTEKDIDNAIKLIIEDKNADSLVSVVKVPHNFNPYSVMIYNGQYLNHYIKDLRIYRSQDKPPFYARNGPAIFISTYEIIMNKRLIYGEKCLPYFMSLERSIDIDSLFDWEIAEYLIKKKLSK